MISIYLLSFIVIFLTIILRYKNYSKTLNIPGPKRLPLIGNLHQMKPLPHEKFLDWYNEYGNIFYMKFGSYNTVVISEAEVMKEAFLENSDVFYKRFIKNSRKNTSNKTNLASSNGENWKKTRRILSQGMTMSKLKDFNKGLIEETEYLSKYLKENYIIQGKAVDIGPVIGLYSLNNICRIAMSVNYSYDLNGKQAVFYEMIHDYFIQLGNPFPGDFIKLVYPLFKNKPKEFYELYKDIFNHVDGFVKEKEAKGFDEENPKDIMENLIVASRRDKDATFNVAATCIDLFTAGSDTTSNTVSYLIREMCNKPNLQEKLFNELKQVINLQDQVQFKDLKASTPYLNACILEVKRRYPTAPLGVPHKVAKDIEFRGYFITKGTQIVTNIYASHLSPKFWDEPREFNPNRFIGPDAQENINKLCIFGFGNRNCVGLNLADLELYTAIATLFRRFKFSRPTSDPIPLGDIFGLTMKAKPFECLVENRDI